MPQITLKDKILLQTFEDTFFLNLAIRIRLPYYTTKIQLKKIHQSILDGTSEYGDYSPMLQKAYNYYLEHLELINKTLEDLKHIN